MAPLRMITAGESHGPGLTCVLEGLPAGLELDRDAINRDMRRRQLGHGRGGRMKIEQDTAEPTAGVRHGRTLGSPVALSVVNRDYANWEERMNPWPVAAALEEVHLPRPGHADLAGVMKHGFRDVRDVLERASARETAARVAGGALCKAFLRALGVEIVSHVRQIGVVCAPSYPEPLALEAFADVDSSPVRCLDADSSLAMVEHIDAQRKANESLGGIFEVRAYGLVTGLGSYVSWEERLDGRLAGALCSIQAVKGVNLGEGFDLAGKPGSLAHDEIFHSRASRLLSRDQPRRRARGRHDERGDADRRRGDEAAPNPDQAAAFGRHRDAGAGTGAARADRLMHRSGGGRGGGGDGRVRPRRRLPAPSSAATTSRDVRGALAAYPSDGPVKADGAIVLVGFMGAGKTTAAQRVGAERGLRVNDVDGLIEARGGATIAELFERDGEAAFRALEEEVVCELLARAHRGDIVSLGGGAVSSERVRERAGRSPRGVAGRRPGTRLASRRGRLRPAAGARTSVI